MHRRIARLALAAVALSAAPSLAADTWTYPYPGISMLRRTTGHPNVVHVLVIDLCTPGVGVRATSSGERFQRTSTWASARGVEAAVNGDFFANGKTFGLSVGGGQLWTDTADGRPNGFVGFGDGLATISLPWHGADGLPGGITDLVSGLDVMVANGVRENLTNCDTNECVRHPRTAVGMTPDKRTLFLFSVDGRQNGFSIGMTQPEVADILQELGATDIFSFDGGGSTTLWLGNAGIVNRPSDGAERTVANHLGIHADGVGVGRPGSCVELPLEDFIATAHELDLGGSSDVDGDGKMDACARSASDFRCHPSLGGEFAEPIVIEEITEAGGWGDPSHYSTIRMADVTGDGKADVCARASDGMWCWPSMGTAFGERFAGPPLTNDNGWAAAEHYTTIRLIDVTGDKKADVCARSVDALECWPSTGTGFGEPLRLTALSNDAGFDALEHYGTIRMADLDFDGRADVCARSADGVSCYLAKDGGFGSAIVGPGWTDEGGWGNARYWSTIRLADIDGDGRADLCGRGSDGLFCHLFDGTKFGEPIEGPMSDANGWDDQANYLTIRMADITGDGASDVCARSNNALVCWPSLHASGGGWGEAIEGPELSDAFGWYATRYYRTLRLADIDGDGKADACARGGAGVTCWRSDGAGFPTEITGPDWADDGGWWDPRYHTTMRIAGPVQRRPEDPEPDPDGDGKPGDDSAMIGGCCGATTGAGVAQSALLGLVLAGMLGRRRRR